MHCAGGVDAGGAGARRPDVRDALAPPSVSFSEKAGVGFTPQMPVRVRDAAWLAAHAEQHASASAADGVARRRAVDVVLGTFNVQLTLAVTATLCRAGRRQSNANSIVSFVSSPDLNQELLSTIGIIRR